MRILPAGDDGLLVEVADLDGALALFAALDHDPAPGTTEVVPAARTVLVRFVPGATAAAAVAAHLRRLPVEGAAGAPGPVVRIPVVYDGEDLAEVAALCRTDPADVVRRHTGAAWTVAFTGFAPGFAYLTGGDPRLAVPRRTTPRPRIPAGAVALAGSYSGVYPRASPGGWQLIGSTPSVVWDLDREPPALLHPGTRVRFVDAASPQGRELVDLLPRRRTTGSGAAAAAAPPTGPALEVVAPGTLTLVEDLGRPGRASTGVSRSGAADRASLRRANRLVGNPPGAAALETAGGLRVRARGRLVLALTGARAAATARTSTGALDVPADAAFALDHGEVLHLGPPDRGVLSYLAVRGSFTVEPVLDSASTDLLSGLGPRVLAAGDVLPVGTGVRTAVALPGAPLPELPSRDDVVQVDVVLGPREDWFTPESLSVLCSQEWVVTPSSNRVGVRLAGGVPLTRAGAGAGELPSEGTVPGAVQVPADGQPVVFAADHPVTGGYPVIACVAGHHLDLVAQVPAGARIRFRPLPGPLTAPAPPEGSTS